MVGFHTIALTLWPCMYWNVLTFPWKFYSIAKKTTFIFPRTAGGAFIWAALTAAQLCVKWAACMCLVHAHAVPCTHTHTPVCVSKPIHLFPLWSACVRYGDISVAPGSADVAANASGLFFPNHAGSHQTPYCCSYGLVSSRYWPPAGLRAGDRLIKDTWECAACLGRHCSFLLTP